MKLGCATISCVHYVFWFLKRAHGVPRQRDSVSSLRLVSVCSVRRGRRGCLVAMSCHGLTGDAVALHTKLGLVCVALCVSVLIAIV